MTPADPHDEMRDLAAPYALGSLTQHEARSFEEHLAEGCGSCEGELCGFEAVVSDLAFAVAEAEPQAGVFMRLQRLTAEYGQVAIRMRQARPSPTFMSIRASEREWHEISEGIQVQQLFVDEVSGLQTSLVKMAAGTRLPSHRHRGVEQFFILEGDCIVNGELLGPGDYHRAESGSVHEVTYTKLGTMFVLVAPESWEVVIAE
ncbi:MAG TPA: cupin domain-containing protein [Blastocatellia bacterium]|nr:cupin domain-containing protein [Blastocatellia bacterium]